MRKVPRSIYEAARDVARSLFGTEAYAQSRRDRKKVEMQFAHLKRILRLDRLRLRGPRGARDEFLLAATAQNLRKACQARHPPAAGSWGGVRCVRVGGVSEVSYRPPLQRGGSNDGCGHRAAPLYPPTFSTKSAQSRRSRPAHSMAADE